MVCSTGGHNIAFANKCTFSLYLHGKCDYVSIHSAVGYTYKFYFIMLKCS